jgi:hypothetical protein
MAKWRTLNAFTGGLSKPSKMPCYGWSIPASECRVGSILAKRPGSTCSGCYALKGRYRMGSVQNALRRRLERYTADPSAWAAAMVRSLRKTRSTHFRWFDSGDLQSVEMLDYIVRIARATPEVTHWLPTREYAIVRQWRRFNGDFPSNLTIRVSAPMIGGPAPDIDGTVSSGVSTDGTHTCPAYTQQGKCGDCRACWDSTIDHVTYPKH